MGKYKFINRKFPKEFQKVVDYIKTKKGVDVKLGQITSYMGPFNRRIFIHHNYDLRNNGLIALLHEIGHVLQPPTNVGVNSYKNIDIDVHPKEYEMGRFLNEVDAWERGYKLSEKLNLKINKNEWNNQKQEALLTYWPNHISV
jgi:hypothetical protein|tara:strand:+ start:148 stop:576 length:429 start_codon:yes stop_codon:yes gene_type:complete